MMVKYNIKKTFTEDITIMRKFRDGLFYNANEDKVYHGHDVGLDYDTDYEGYVIAGGIVYPYTDRFIESFYESYGIKGMSDKSSELRERYLVHLTQVSPKLVNLLSYDGKIIYADKDLVEPVLGKIIRRYQRIHPNTVSTSSVNNMTVLLSLTERKENGHRNTLDISYNLFTGEFEAYESEFNEDILLYCNRITR